MRLLTPSAALLLGLLAGSPAWAVNPDEMLPDPGQEARARALGQGLRCLVCQNESIDESEADIAHDLRQIVREQIRAGQSDEQIERFLVERYGDYVLLKPPFKSTTLVLWLGPPLLLLLGAGTAALFYRRRRTGAAPAEAPLSPEEQRRLDRVLEERGE